MEKIPNKPKKKKYSKMNGTMVFSKKVLIGFKKFKNFIKFFNLDMLHP